VSKSAENTFNISYKAATVPVARSETTNSTAWLFHVMTFSYAADQVIYYFNGSPTETDTSIGAWVGAISSVANVGCQSPAVPTTSPWHGYISHVAMWDKVLTAAQVAALYAAGNPT